MLASLRAGRRVPQLRGPSTRAFTSSSRWNYASVTDLSSLPKPGHRLHGFTLARAKHVPELELSALHFTHDKTGADYLHVARDDKNNVFSIGFKTNPPDATGVPHILEHVTLCGSEKYPVRDPFFKMLPRSLQNFMNAFTSSDYTMYPFATTNAQDFKNLMGVYLDATLHPLLKRTDFFQEGWRVGPENPLVSDDSQGVKDLVFKGVVYNEMKGQVSDATYLFYIKFMEQIFPAINNSGGDPQKMTELTYDQLKNFHAGHYHPSNSKILTYGDQPVEHHLEMLGQQLDRFNETNVDSDIKLPSSLADGPKSVTVQGPLDPLTPPDAQYKSSTTWIVGDTTDIAESFALRIASTLLLDGYGAPMYSALIESGLGTDYTPNTGYDTSARKGIFSIGLNGVSEENLPKVKETIAKTIQDTVNKGFSQHKVDGLLHQLELGLKHKTATFGMDLIQRLKPGWFNGIDPFDALAWTSIVDQFKTELAKGGYLEGLVKKYLSTDNTLTFTMAPSESYSADVAAEEAERLQTKISETISQFSSEEEAHEHLRERELELLKEQEAGRTQPLDSLPTLHVSDIPRQQPLTEVRDSTIDGRAKVQWRETSTNGLTYFRAVSPFKNLPDELRMLVPLFCDSLMRIGTRNKTMEELEDLIKLKTGGISFGYHASPSPSNIQQAEEGISLGGYAFDHNIPAMYELLQTILMETDFGAPKAQGMIKQLLQSGASGAVDGIAESGHAYARRFAEASLTPHGRMVEQTAGLSQIKLVTSLASTEENSYIMRELVHKLKIIQSIVVANMQQGMRMALTCGADATSSNEAALQAFLASTKMAVSLPGNAAEEFQAMGSQPMIAQLPYPDLLPALNSTTPTPSKSFFTLPYQVSYSGLAVPTESYTSSAGAPLAILAQLLTHRHLHHEIREKGGAYGGGAYSRGLGGLFGMYSYRDPNPTNTLQIMRTAGRWAAEREWTQRELEEAKLSVFQAVDAPVSVSDEGMTRFLSGVDGRMEQARREWLLDVDEKAVRAAAEKLAAEIETPGVAKIAVLGEKKAFVDEEEGWKVRDMGMAAPVADEFDAAGVA
ncbi:peptidase M16C associated-domain-containing protein [Acrodontium crateriforme]|uniref:Presequence protease, mitochondrial n=1 Tax=Acrodontium crateriforme TaxID=150365 RepID=A0AAQ3R6V3_9PEZI|nr:peptidase M16C associated-domain-containing protein [Acrodontium crateriforme]